MEFATFTSPILRFAYPPTFCISIVFNFSWDIQSSQETFKTILMQNVGEQAKCIMGDVEMVNIEKARENYR